MLQAEDIEHIQNVENLVKEQKEIKKQEVEKQGTQEEEKPKEIKKTEVPDKVEASKPEEGSKEQQALQENFQEKKEQKIEEANKPSQQPKTNENINKEDHPALKDVHEDFHFNTHDGRNLKNVTELSEYVKNLDEESFRNYVNEEKNDFYQWVKNSVKDEQLAEKIKQVKSKKDVSKEIIDKIKSIS